MSAILVASAAITIWACTGVAEPAAEQQTEEVTGTLEAPPLRSLVVRASAYSYSGSRTRMGTVPAWGTVAVDPSVIPLGSRLLISGFDGTEFRALDTGGAIRGAMVDIFFPSYGAAIQFGVQTRTITILE